MKKYLLRTLMSLIIARLDPETMRKIVDGFLDRIEGAIDESESQADDQVLLPLIKLVREAFNIPDNDSAPEPDPTEPIDGPRIVSE